MEKRCSSHSSPHSFPMSPYWAVLSSLLLLLLPHAVNSESAEDKMKQFKGTKCHVPEEHDCAEGKCTLHCFTYIFCQDNSHQKSSDHPDGTKIVPADTRLLLTAASMLIVDDTGRILESYINEYTSVWYRHFVEIKGIMRGYSIPLRFPVGLEESKKKAAKLTDMILYMGSDFADSYEPLTYKYDKRYLQLKDGSTKITSNLHTNSAFPICFVYEGAEGGRKIFNSPTTAQDPNNWISSPGIYRLNFASGKITELNYDPSMSTYLM